MAGSGRSPRKFSVERVDWAAPICAIALLAVIADAVIAAEGLRPYAISGDAIPAPLTGKPGDPAQGRAIIVNRQVGLCLLCHSGPFPEEKFQGTLAPNMKGAGSRWSEGQLRLRIVNAGHLNPNTIMPAYYQIDGLTRVASAFAGKPILTAEQIEDVVAFLTTLRDEDKRDENTTEK